MLTLSWFYYLINRSASGQGASRTLSNFSSSNFMSSTNSYVQTSTVVPGYHTIGDAVTAYLQELNNVSSFKQDP